MVAKARVEFRVVIPMVASLKLLDHPRELVVTERDVAAGEVVIEGVRLQARVNRPAGAGLRVEIMSGPVAGVEIVGFGAGTTGNWPVAYRFRLKEGAQPGRYPWPVVLSLHLP